MICCTHFSNPLNKLCEFGENKIELVLVLRVAPLKRVTFIHRECSLFSRFLVFDIFCIGFYSTCCPLA